MRTNRRYSPTPFLSEKGAHALYWLWTHAADVFVVAALVVVAVVMGYVAVTHQ